MSGKPATVVVTAVGSTTAQSVIKGLRKQRRHSVRIVGTDTHSGREIDADAYCDRFVTVPPASRATDLVRVLKRLVYTEDARLLVPIHDRELSVLSVHRGDFPQRCCVLVSSPATVETCNDKWETYRALTDWGIPTFRTILPHRQRRLAAQVSAANLRYPLIAKPRDGVSSRNVYEIRNPNELVLVQRIQRPILQERGHGPEFTIDSFSTGREVLAIVPRLRVETRAGISYRGRTVHDGPLERLARRIVERLSIFGPANIQVLRTSCGDQVVEVNPRFSGGLPLTVASGVNSPSMALQLALGERVRPVLDFRSVTMHRRLEENFHYQS
jgi:carbamoyl-phosphate synthase large subunit